MTTTHALSPHDPTRTACGKFIDDPLFVRVRVHYSCAKCRGNLSRKRPPPGAPVVHWQDEKGRAACVPRGNPPSTHEASEVTCCRCRGLVSFGKNGTLRAS